MGPLRTAWCFSYESKNNSLKQLNIRNYKNVAYSLMKFSQLKSAYDLSSDNFLSAGDECKAGLNIAFTDVYPRELWEQFIQATQGLVDDEVSQTTEFTFNGQKYRKDACLLLSWDNNWPKFAKIRDLFMKDDFHIAVCTELETLSYNWRVNAYQVNDTDTNTLVIVEQLQNFWPIPEHEIKSERYIVNRYGHFCQGVH